MSYSLGWKTTIYSIYVVFPEAGQRGFVLRYVVFLEAGKRMRLLHVIFLGAEFFHLSHSSGWKRKRNICRILWGWKQGWYYTSYPPGFGKEHVSFTICHISWRKEITCLGFPGESEGGGDSPSERSPFWAYSHAVWYRLAFCAQYAQMRQCSDSVIAMSYRLGRHSLRPCVLFYYVLWSSGLGEEGVCFLSYSLGWISWTLSYISF